MTKKKKKKKKKKVITAVVITGGTAGTAMCVQAMAQHSVSLELDLVKTRNSSGKLTGHGNMFENVAVRENPGSHKVNNPGSVTNPLLREKNGVDIQLKDGTNVQAKCCNSAENAFKGLIKGGEYRYPGQTVYVPKGQGAKLQQMFHDAKIDAEIREANLTYEEVKKLCKPGLASIRFDASDPSLLIPAGIAGAIVAGSVWLYLKINEPEKSTWNRTWKTIAYGVLASSVCVGGCVLYGQIKRM